MPDDTKLPALAPQQHIMPLDAMQRLAESIAKSGMFGIRTADQALVLMSIAQAEGRHPALAARDYHIIQGAPAKKAEAMARDFLSASGRIEWHQLDDDAADATFSHPSGGSARIRWDQARVAKAGLGSNQMHRKFPRQMLRSRVVSEGVRTVWPMATSGMYVPEEVAEFGPSQAEPLDITPKADLDAFAGQVPLYEPPDRPAEYRAAAMEAAREGAEGFRDYWKRCDKEAREALRPDLGEYQRVAQDADAYTAMCNDAGHDEDPFGLPPLGTAADAPQSPPAAAAPAPSAGPPAAERPHSAPRDTTNTPAGTHNPNERIDAAIGPPDSVSKRQTSVSQNSTSFDAGKRDTQPAGGAWQQRFDALDPGPGDLAGDPYWPEYVRDAVALIGEATADDLFALRLTSYTHMQALRKSDGDGYRQITEAVAARAKALNG